MSIEHAAGAPGPPRADPTGGRPPPSGPPATGDDAALLAAVPHDPAAFATFYRRHVRRVTGFAVGRCTTPEDVADVVAQTFLRLPAAAARYDPTKGDPAAYLLGIAANVVRELGRQQARRRALVHRLRGRDLLDDDDTERIEAAIDAARHAPGLRRALAGVPPGERAVLHLVAEGASPGQAARHLGISPGAARTRLARARRRIRETFTPETDQEHAP